MMIHDNLTQLAQKETEHPRLVRSDSAESRVQTNEGSLLKKPRYQVGSSRLQRYSPYLSLLILLIGSSNNKKQTHGHIIIIIQSNKT